MEGGAMEELKFVVLEALSYEAKEDLKRIEDRRKRREKEQNYEA